jgi:heparinase II/III-like protein
MTCAPALAGRHEIAPRPVFCVIGHAYRDRGVADDACRGTFTFAGETVDLGPEPDWVAAALPDDREWRIEWTKLYFGLDLAHAFDETADARYLGAWQRLVSSYLRQVPPGEGLDDTSDVAARRVQNLVYAWSAFTAAPHFPGLRDGFDRELLDGIRDHVAFIRDNLTAERNHRTLELYALLIVALALPELDRDGELLRFAMTELHANLMADVRPDGVHREQSTHYHCIVLRSFLGARENARRFGLAFPDGYDEQLARACEFAMHCHRPDGTIAALSDSDSGSYTELLELAADLLDREDLRWAATAGAAGEPPARRYVSFAQGGYHVQRSGWGDRGRAYAAERWLIFDSGPLGDGGHGHYDLLNVEIAADGRPLVLDPGRFTYDEQEPNLRHWFKGTAAHNTVVVDGLDQTPYRRGKPRKGTIARGRLVERHSAPGLDVVVAEATSTAYDAVHTRRVVFVADEYWVIEDRLAGRTPHRYDLRFHLAPDADGRVAVERRDGASVVRAPGVALVVLGDGAPTVEPGWVAPDYGIRHRAPVVSVVADGTAEATFTTLVLPLPDGADVPGVTLRSCEEATALELTGPRFADTVCWSRGGFPLDLGPLRCRATAGWMRRCSGGAVRVRAAGVGGGPVWAGWDDSRGMSAGREGEL